MPWEINLSLVLDLQQLRKLFFSEVYPNPTSLDDLVGSVSPELFTSYNTISNTCLHFPTHPKPKCHNSSSCNKLIFTFFIVPLCIISLLVNSVFPKGKPALKIDHIRKSPRNCVKQHVLFVQLVSLG